MRQTRYFFVNLLQNISHTTATYTISEAVILTVGLKQAHTWWFASRLSERPDANQESHELMEDPQASTLICQHN